MKEMQKSLDEMSPEDKKTLESNGFKMPSTKNVPKPGDKALAAANSNNNTEIPVKNNAKIAKINAF